METKICSHCNTEKPVSDFHKNAARPDGLQEICKDCKREANLQARQKAIKAKSERNAEYNGITDREVQERVKSLLNELRARGWQVECKIAYLQTKSL